MLGLLHTCSQAITWVCCLWLVLTPHYVLRTFAIASCRMKSLFSFLFYFYYSCLFSRSSSLSVTGWGFSYPLSYRLICLLSFQLEEKMHFETLDWALITTYPFTPLHFKVFWILYQDYPPTSFCLCQSFFHRFGNLTKLSHFRIYLRALTCLVLNISWCHLEHSVRN